VSRDSAEKKYEQTAIGAYIRADYNVEILGQKRWALKRFLAFKNSQNLGLGKKIKSRLQLVGLSELLLKIPDSFRVL